MTEPLEIVVYWDPAKTAENQLRNVCWQERARRQKAARDRAFLAWRAIGAPQYDRPVQVDVLVRRGRSMDIPNVIGGLKPLIDGAFVGWERHFKVGPGQRKRVIRQRAMLPDDSPRWFRLGTVELETDADYRGSEEVVFTVTLLEEG